MKNVAIVTGPAETCGIYQHAYSTYTILKTSNKYAYHLVTAGSESEFAEKISALNPCAIIYNHHPATLSWLHRGITRMIATQGTKQIVITGHENVHKFMGVDSYVFTDPYKVCGENEYAGIIPILYDDTIKYSKPEGVIKIGTSGISNVNKSPENIIGLINEQFTEDVVVNLHLSNGAYVDASGTLTNSIVETFKKNAKSNIQINVTAAFLEPHELIKWLNGNDINLYWYHTSPNLPGVSGSIDRALAAKKPFGVNESSFFSHVRRDFNNLHKTPIKTIIESGIDPLNEFYDMWNASTLIKLYEDIIEND
jgi:hypothetical protein